MGGINHWIGIFTSGPAIQAALSERVVMPEAVLSGTRKFTWYPLIAPGIRRRREPERTLH